MAQKKFTFKTIKPTGKWSGFQSNQYTIKYNGIEVGAITPERPFQARFMIIKEDINEDNNPNCKWRWITLKKQFDGIDKAKEWLNENRHIILNKFKLVTE